MEWLLLNDASDAQNWSIGDLLVIGSVCGAIGGAITGTALVLQSQRRQDREIESPAEKKLTNRAGVIGGFVAALLGTYAPPLRVMVLTEGPPGSANSGDFLTNMALSSALCIPTYLVVCIPLAIGCGRIALGLARASGRTDARPWVWFGAVVGAVAGLVLCTLVPFAAHHNAF
jgi:hypothetical protein